MVSLNCDLRSPRSLYKIIPNYEMIRIIARLFSGLMARRKEPIWTQMVPEARANQKTDILHQLAPQRQWVSRQPGRQSIRY